MASSWGLSWGTSWGNSWGDTGTAPQPPAQSAPSGGLFQFYDKYAERELAQKRKALEELNKEIAVIEREEKPLIRKAKRNTGAEIKLLALRDEINALRLEREALLRMIDDEEAIFILLASTPFH